MVVELQLEGQEEVGERHQTVNGVIHQNNSNEEQNNQQVSYTTVPGSKVYQGELVKCNLVEFPILAVPYISSGNNLTLQRIGSLWIGYFW